MAFLHEEEDDHNDTDESKEYGAEDRYSSEPQKAHLTGEFVIVAKFDGHALRHLASRLANVVRQGLPADCMALYLEDQDTLIEQSPLEQSTT